MLSFAELFDKIEENLFFEELNVFKCEKGVCLYKLELLDDEFSDLILSFKLIINENLNWKIVSNDFELNGSEKILSWTHLNEIIYRNLNEQDDEAKSEAHEDPQEIIDYDEIIEEIKVDELYNPDEEIIEDNSQEDLIEYISDNLLKCQNCQIVFKNALGLQHHSATCSTKKNVKQTCKICDLDFTSNLQLHMHMKSHDIKERIKCPYCEKELVNSGSLQRHIKAVHFKERPHKCSICGKAFSTSTIKIAHEITHNRNSEFQKYLDTDDNGSVCYKCPNCKDSFETSNYLKNHMEKNCYRARKKRIYRYPCKYCGKQFITKIRAASHYSDDHGISIGNPQKFCFECNVEVEDYVNHIRIHTCQYKCSICGCKFLTEETCRQHEFSKHSISETRPFSCSYDDCQVSFKNEHHLKSHMSSVHNSSERQHTCDICGSKFLSKSLLSAHLRTHDQNSAIFACKTCGKAFKKLLTLKNHSIAHHQTDKIYECDIDGCYERYKFLQDLKTHRQVTHGLNLNVQKYFREGDEYF